MLQTTKLVGVALLVVCIFQILIAQNLDEYVYTHNTYRNQSRLVQTVPLLSSSILVHPSKKPLDISFRPPESETFCKPWSLNTDSWWTHNPEWVVSSENLTHFCFSIMQNQDQRNYTLQLYRNQWQGDCSHVYSRQMMNSGWAADFTNLGFGLIRSLEHNQPFAIRQDPRFGFWHYSANKPMGSNPTCAAKDTSCYFLDMGKCFPNDHPDLTEWMPEKSYFHNYATAYRYVTRQKQWLRRQVLESQQAMSDIVHAPCTVVHVRRSDIVLHKDYARKYFPISAYVDLIPENRRTTDTLFLLTDDQNAIEEAHEFYPDLKWKYFHRKRYRATEGGWEMQVPSQDPKQEVVVILTTFALVNRCDIFVHGNGKFSAAIRQAMPKRTKDLSVDKGSTIFDIGNAESHLELQKALEDRRMEHH